MRLIVLALIWAPLALRPEARAAAPPLLATHTLTTWGALQGAPVGIKQLAQTPDGWLWMSTELGLYRFDGILFERVDAVYGSPLQSNDVHSLLVTKDGALWVSYRLGGASVFRKNGAHTFGADAGLPAGTILNMREAPDGAVWATTRVGAARLAPGGDRFALQGAAVGLPEKPVHALLFAGDGTQWVASEAGVFLRRPNETRFARVWQGKDIRILQEGHAGAIWARTVDFDHYLVGGPNPRAAITPRRMLRASAQAFDREGGTWVLDTDRVRRLADGPTSESTAQPLTRADGVIGRTSSFLQDREGTIWIGGTAGLHRLRRNRLQLLPVSEDLFQPAIMPGPGRDMWFSWGSEHGDETDSLDPAGRWTRLSARRITASHTTPDGALWTAATDGLERRAPDGATALFVRPPEQRGRDVQALQHDRDGALWVSISGGGGIFRLVDGKWIRDGGLTGIPRKLTLSLAMDADGAIWMGHTENAISLAGPGAGQTSVRHLGAEAGLAVGSVLALHPDGATMWVGGERGSMRYRDGRFLPLRGKRGETFRGVSGIVRTPDGDLWLHGADGVYRVPAASLAAWSRDPARLLDFERFDALDGLRGNAPQLRPLPTAVRSQDGRLWFATGETVAWIDPARVHRNRLAPPVALRRVTANDIQYEAERLNTLALPEGTTSLRVSYTALSLTMPERVRFRYRLAGVDQGWQEAAERRAASYTNLAPGAYRFEVIAANEDGVWSERPATLELHIAPTFVQTRWFAALMILAALLVLYLAYALRVRFLSRRMRERHAAQLQERSRIARSLHDTFLQSLQGVLLSFDAHVRRVPGDAGERAKLERTMGLGWDLLVEGRNQIAGLRAANAPDELLLALRPVGDDLAAHGGHAFVIRTSGTPRSLQVQAYDELYAIGREGLFNAARHAHAGQIAIELDYGDAAFTLRIRDDGCGLALAEAASAEAQHHWGLPGMRERAQAIGAAFDLASAPGAGTTISVTLPARRAYQDEPERRWLRWFRRRAPDQV